MKSDGKETALSQDHVSRARHSRADPSNGLAWGSTNVSCTAPGLLCVANFSESTGFAWSFIGDIYSDVAERLAQQDIKTWVAYPRVMSQGQERSNGIPESVALPIRLADPSSVYSALRFVRRNQIKVLYLADRPAWHPAYLAFRAAGVRKIVVHDHSSGARTEPVGVKRVVKKTTRELPGMLADVVIGVSDFVAKRKIQVDLVPPERVVRIWNGVSRPRDDGGTSGSVLANQLGLPPNRPWVGCACRAAPEKGVEHLLAAFDLVARDYRQEERPLLVYIGDGPDRGRLENLRRSMNHSEDIVFVGYRDDADAILAAAALVVVPSVWEEAFGLTALEAMSAGVPVIASAVGGLPEVVVHGETGLLVPPADARALAVALRRLLNRPEERDRFGKNARERASRCFSWDRLIGDVTDILKEGFE